LEKQRKPEKNLKEYENLLDKYFYHLSHSIRSPICTMQGIVQMINQHSTSEENWVECLQDQLTHLDNIIKSLAKTYELETHQLKTETVNLVDILTQSIYTNIEEKSHNIQYEIDSNGIDKIYTDEFLIKCVLDELISNAVKFRKKHIKQSFIKINIRKNRKQIIIKIQDNGMGIEPRIQYKIFDIFSKFSNDGLKTVGMGLYMVQKALKMLNGRILIDSTYGRGTEVQIILNGLQ